MTYPADIAAHLDTLGYGKYNNVTPSLNSIFLDEWQDLPANQIIVIASRGLLPWHASGGSVFRIPGLDIQVRNTSKATARSMAQAILVALDNNLGIAGHQAIFADCSGSVYLGMDTSNRHKFVVTFFVYE